MTLTLESILAKLPIRELNDTVAAHIVPLVQRLPDKRLGAVVECILLGILGSQTPVITEMAGTNSKAKGETWPVAKRIYRFLHNPACRRKACIKACMGSGSR